MRRRRKRSVWGPRLAVVLLFCAAAGGLWVALRSTGDSTESATTTTVRRHVTKAPPRRHVVPKPKPIARLKLPATPRAGSVALPILMYHRIDDLDPSLPSVTRRLTVDPTDFAEQMQWLKANGYHPVTEREAYNAIVRGRKLPSKPIMITFDDGYRDVLRYAAPVLKRLHMPSTAYIITDRVSGPDTSFVTWGMLKRMERAGMAVGSHTVSHPDLTTLSAADALAQMHTSRRILEKHLGHPVQWFAYPAGSENSSVVEGAQKAGYVLAVTTQPGANQDAAHPLELHRYEVLDSTGVAGLSGILRGY